MHVSLSSFSHILCLTPLWLFIFVFFVSSHYHSMLLSLLCMHHLYRRSALRMD